MPILRQNELATFLTNTRAEFMMTAGNLQQGNYNLIK